MCLNRYYVAAGVRQYSNETWRLLFANNGKELLSRYPQEVSKYYCSQSMSDDQSDREAACHCIAEIGTKLAVLGSEYKDSFKPYIAELLSCLVFCLRDESWLVRDAACVATGSFVACFAEESQQQFQEIADLWITHLSENIFSVRHHSAKAIATVFESAGIFREELEKRVNSHLAANILRAKEQKTASEQFKTMLVPKQTGIPKQPYKHENDLEHVGKQMFCCCTIAHKHSNNCMDHGFIRQQEPWEISDGCIFLLREMSQV